MNSLQFKAACGEDLESQINMHIKRHKFAIYKSCVTNFKLKYREIYKAHYTSPIFHLKVSDMIVDCFETNVFLLKNKILENDFKYWEAIILGFLQISKFGRKYCSKDVQRLLCPAQDLTADKTEIDSEMNFPQPESNYIANFLDEFIRNRKNSTVFVLDKEQYNKSTESLSEVLNNMKRPKKSTLLVPLTVLKNSVIGEWSCPTFNLNEA